MNQIYHLDFSLDFLTVDEQYLLMELDYAIDKRIQRAISRILSPKAGRPQILVTSQARHADDELYIDLEHYPER